MKKSVLLSALLIFSLKSIAQVPHEANKALVTCGTATWCGPCGNYGMDVEDYFYTTMGSKGFLIDFHPSTSTNNEDNLFSNQTAIDWVPVFDPYYSFPVFAVNAIDKSYTATYVADMVTAVEDAVNSFPSKEVIASTGFRYTRVNNVFTVNTVTKFWQEGNGDYYLGAFLLEDSILHSQSGRTDTPYHLNVLRASMAGTSFGDMITSGAVSKGATFNKTFTYTVTNGDWNLQHMKVVVLLFKKTGTGYTYINGNDEQSVPMGIEDTKTAINTAVYPNPANDHAELAITLNKPSHVSITMVDAVGKTVYRSSELSFNTGRSTHNISTAELAAGQYNILIHTEDGDTMERLSVIK